MFHFLSLFVEIEREQVKETTALEAPFNMVGAGFEPGCTHGKIIHYPNEPFCQSIAFPHYKK